MSRKLSLKGLSISLAFILSISNVSAQIWKKLSEASKNIQSAAQEVTTTTRQLNATSREINSTVRAIKQTWKKDTSSNIRYHQVPDYRTRDEVAISNNQKLSVVNGQFKNLSWEPVTKFDNQIFPSFVIGWAAYKGPKEEDMGSSLGFNIKTALPNVVLKWEIEATDKNYLSIDSGYINCDELKRTAAFMPRIDWNYRALTRHQTSAPLNIYFRLIDPNTGNRVEKLINVNLRSINDCLTRYNGKKYQYLFTSYVNEDHPEIDRILKQMIDTKMIDAVLGYQWGTAYVDLQVAALWRVLHDRGFHYSSITNNSGDNDSKGVFSQTVRTFDVALKTNQANCVDGTVVFASVLKRIGIRPVMVTIPGHCFLGYYTSDTTTSDIHFLETTMLSNTTFIANPKTSVQKYNDVLGRVIPKGVKLSELNKAYLLEFLNAEIAGADAYKKNMQQYGKDYVSFLDVSELRKYVKPIPLYN